MTGRRLVLSFCAMFCACSGADAPSSPSQAVSPVEESGADLATADDTGDAYLQSGSAAPGYLDEVKGSVSTPVDGTIRFTDTLAAPIPEEPALPEEDDALAWSFCVDSDPLVSAPGFPMVSPMPCEFIVHVRWDGKKLSGLLIDRRPLADGDDARTMKIEPMLSGDSVSMDVPVGSLGDPKRFKWSMFTEELGPFGTDEAFHVDEVPEGGFSVPTAWHAA